MFVFLRGDLECGTNCREALCWTRFARTVVGSGAEPAHPVSEVAFWGLIGRSAVDDGEMP